MKSKIFTRVSVLALMILVFSLAASPKEEIVQSAWASTPLNIDGSNTDWQDVTMNFAKNVEVEYAFKNDAQYLYVFFTFKNPKYMTTVRMTGITLWFRTEGKDKKTYGIKFKEKQVSGDELIAILEKQQGQLPEDQKKQLKAKAFYSVFLGEVIDKKGKILTPTALGGELEVPMFRQKGSQAGMSYEFRLLLNTLEKLAAELRLEPGKTVNLGFEWGGMTKELLERKVEQLEGRSDPELRSLERESSSSDAFQMESVRRGTQKFSFWVNVQLAQSQQ